MANIPPIVMKLLKNIVTSIQKIMQNEEVKAALKGAIMTMVGAIVTMVLEEKK
ncbi:hypothetical protein CIRMBP1271_00448 [Enterococcus cecorum]|uniref:hypothetical protein n=1 Tax=Enterococcus cecorum TaxID=44008 RepID=UPI000A9013AC|nr:hypothetical protein [Enterococcus cecorum]CAI3252920.1 hypothetical protein CIRMBP1243_00049 [Enterococcus cecorum]CAI3253276.1 hypothetical protein CIRMBP1195_00037 [Enterococcus cecorum]CAI3253503.1 hypothetical protein CIRMBP1217_00036 [Enterococcus cecorum]CAI3254302.1 hypothetical protein CIRMBP1240_00065 [Enterococcus cecorum]CAI3254342.1 hypothetical protein CIRMBP1226_00065 [Enterococcus cecorum]